MLPDSQKWGNGRTITFVRCGLSYCGGLHQSHVVAKQDGTFIISILSSDVPRLCEYLELVIR